MPELAPAKENTNLPVPLHHAIAKLTSHHRFILQLLKYASSAAGSNDLRNMTVVAKEVVAGVVDVELPTTSQVENIIRPLIMPGVNLQDEMNLVIAGIKKEFKPLELHPDQPVPFQAFVHCECALIADFNLDVHPDLEPFRYIGVSKLSCAACNLWINAFNMTHHAQYHTRGTHGKWYPKWAMPTSLQTNDILGSMREVLEDAYKRHTVADVREILLSDSTEAKGSLSDITVTSLQSASRLTQTRSDRITRLAKGRSMPPPTNKMPWIKD